MDDSALFHEGTVSREEVILPRCLGTLSRDVVPPNIDSWTL
jgi:hypothetical protein